MVPALEAAHTLALPLLAPNRPDQGHPTKRSQIASAFALAALSIGAAQAATVRTTDHITSPTHFNGFEGISGGSNGDFGPTYTEGGITVTQVNGEANDIWTTSTLYTGGQGNYSWYPNGGDFGYTDITLQGGGLFGDISFIAGSGFGGGAHSLYDELALGGSVVQSGTLSQVSGDCLGFSGGGFDEVRVRDSYSLTASLNDGQVNAVAIDSIKTVGAVPEPETYALMLAGLCAVGWVARRKQRAA